MGYKPVGNTYKSCDIKLITFPRIIQWNLDTLGPWKLSFIQWNLSIKDTLGPWKMSESFYKEHIGTLETVLHIVEPLYKGNIGTLETVRIFL